MIVSERSSKDHHDSEAGDKEHEQLLTLLDPPLDLLHLQDVAHLKIRLEIEFSDINLTKDSSLLLRAIHGLLHWWILQKTILYCSFKTPYNKIRNTRKLESFHE
jgi:hypothetical protein